MKARVQALNQDFEGKVSRFSGSLDRQTRTMETEIDFSNKDGRLIPGMYAEAVLSLAKNANELCIPTEAVSRSNNEATVLALNDQNVIEERHVKLGFEGEAYIQVLSGLTEGERIVIGGRSQFHPGQKVQPKEAADRPAETAR